MTPQPVASDAAVTPGSGAPRLEVRGLGKTFGRRTVLRDVSLTVGPGEMHGIVGQNGSGKSTFAKAISGYHAPDPGAEIRVDGEVLSLPVSPADLRRRGVSIVHQDLGLIEDASVAENVRIAVMEGGRWSRRIDWLHETREAAAALERLGYRGSLRTPVGRLPIADRALVAIGRAIQVQPHGGGLIIFDESTRALPAEALDEFYDTLSELMRSGTGVLMIGHRLGEMLRHCDRITVLRDGQVVGAGLPSEGMSESDLASRMLGHQLHHLDLNIGERRSAGTPISLRSLHGRGIAEPLDVELAAGEIVGITGLPGSGFEDVPYLASGAHPAEGTLAIGGLSIDLGQATTAQLIRRGVVLVPADRPTEGLGAEHTIAENISLPWLSERGRRWWIGLGWQQTEAEQVIETLGVVPPNPRQIVGRLSGGNAQKVLLGKWLLAGPKLLLLHEPTQGVDVRARLDLLAAVHRAAMQGASVIVASTEPEDLVTICDRVMFFQAGAIVGELHYPFNVEQIVTSVYSPEVKQAGRTPTPVPQP